MELKNFSCNKKKNHNTLYKSLNNIDHLKKELYFYLLSQKKNNGIIYVATRKVAQAHLE